MSIDIETYRLKAQEAIGYVFVKEYHNSLGIPMPIVKMLLPDDANYSTGQYYITIDKTWQIHLNFGKLPISYHEFQNEVKVLTRHEIEHYMCCPFDVITHFRMLKRIRDVYYKHFSHLGINIKYACGAISNQAADIIVDTKNYYRHSKETLKSEIDWIKIGANISACPRHCKLMFLTKEAIWKEDLGINETDPEFLKIVHQLADSFTKNGIEDKSSFLDKVEEYAEIFFKLYVEDQKNPQQSSQQGSQQQSGQQGPQQQSGQQGSQQQSGQQGSQQQSGQQGPQQQSGQQGSQQQSGQQGSQQQSGQQGPQQQSGQQGSQQQSGQQGSQQQSGQQGPQQQSGQQGSQQQSGQQGSQQQSGQQGPQQQSGQQGSQQQSGQQGSQQQSGQQGPQQQSGQQGSQQQSGQQGSQQQSGQQGPQQQSGQQGSQQQSGQQGSQQQSGQQGPQQQSGQQGSQQQSGQQGSQQQSGQQGPQQQSGQQGSQQQSGQQGSQQQSGQWGVGRPKDGDEHGNAFVFADPDKVKEAIEVLAEETSVEEFIDLLAIAGIIGMSDKQKGVLWFNVQSANIIPIVEFSNTGNKSSYTYPSVWRIGDPIEELDLMLTYMTSPRLIPGMTTKKWEYVSNDDNGTESKQMDLLLVVDTSGSMGSAMKESANMHQAVLASYGILSYFESTKSKVAFIGFSDKIDAYVDWSDKYDDVRERLLTNGHGGTKFPISRIKSTLDVRSRDLVTVLITDGDLGNINESVSYFRDYLNDDNKLYIFLLGGSKSLHSYEPLKNIGAKIYNANNANEFCDMVLTDME
ncbi:VWA domain-containing protein [Bacteroides intestinalis]|nr:VWA domain-containing protein [Bacteroides intestinalis]